jgi:hypothetical protein
MVKLLRMSKELVDAVGIEPTTSRLRVIKYCELQCFAGNRIKPYS